MMYQSTIMRLSVAVLLACVELASGGKNKISNRDRNGWNGTPSSFNPLVQAIRNIDQELKQKLKDQYKEVANCSEAISTQAQLFLENNASNDDLALFDSWAKYIGDPGLFTQCTNLGNLYCSVSTNTTRDWTGVCLPPPCSKTQAINITDMVVQMLLPHGSGLTGVKCYGPQTKSIEAMAVITILAVLITFVIICTVYDVLIEEAPAPKYMQAMKRYPIYEDSYIPPSRADSAPPSVQVSDSESDAPLLSYRGGETRRRLPAAGPNSVSRAHSADSDYGDWEYMHASLAQYGAPPPTKDSFQRCGCEEDRDHFKRTPTYTQMLRCFSIKRSWKLLTSNRKACSTGLRIFDGMKVCSIAWIIMGNMLFIEGAFFQDPWYLRRDVLSGKFAVVLSASLATDTFLFIGGFLASYRILHVYASRGEAPSGLRAVLTWLKMIIRRYIRVFPLLALVVIFYTLALPALVNGPLWDLWKEETASCSKGMWYILGFGNNVWTTNCMAWTWYTAVDMQLYILAPILTLMFWHLGAVALVLVMLLCVGCIITNAVLVQAHNIQACSDNLMDMTSLEDFTFLVPWVRATPYLFGITLAFLYNALGEADGAANLRAGACTRAFVLSIVAMTLLTPIVWGFYMRDPSGANAGMCRFGPIENAAYLSLYRLSWSFGIFLLCTTCLLGWSPWPRQILSVHAFTPFSRLVYGVYLIHPILIERLTFGEDTFPTYSDYTYLVNSAGILFLSFVFSFFMSKVHCASCDSCYQDIDIPLIITCLLQ
eukprot:m.300352 g.300352  ORF g.300352 m.300352 type:complete len:767 (-) comp16421_c1_seq22:26-2326(-)